MLHSTSVTCAHTSECVSEHSWQMVVLQAGSVHRTRSFGDGRKVRRRTEVCTEISATGGSFHRSFGERRKFPRSFGNFQKFPGEESSQLGVLWRLRRCCAAASFPPLRTQKGIGRSSRTKASHAAAGQGQRTFPKFPHWVLRRGNGIEGRAAVHPSWPNWNQGEAQQAPNTARSRGALVHLSGVL